MGTKKKFFQLSIRSIVEKTPSVGQTVNYLMIYFCRFSGISGSQAGPGSKKKSVLSIAQPSIGDQDHYHEIDTDGGNFPFHFGAGGAL